MRRAQPGRVASPGGRLLSHAQGGQAPACLPPRLPAVRIRVCRWLRADAGRHALILFSRLPTPPAVLPLPGDRSTADKPRGGARLCFKRRAQLWPFGARRGRDHHGGGGGGGDGSDDGSDPEVGYGHGHGNGNGNGQALPRAASLVRTRIEPKTFFAGEAGQTGPSRRAGCNERSGPGGDAPPPSRCACGLQEHGRSASCPADCALVPRRRRMLEAPTRTVVTPAPHPYHLRPAPLQPSARLYRGSTLRSLSCSPRSRSWRTGACVRCCGMQVQQQQGAVMHVMGMLWGVGRMRRLGTWHEVQPRSGAPALGARHGSVALGAGHVGPERTRWLWLDMLSLVMGQLPFAANDT